MLLEQTPHLPCNFQAQWMLYTVAEVNTTVLAKFLSPSSSDFFEAVAKIKLPRHLAGAMTCCSMFYRILVDEELKPGRSVHAPAPLLLASTVLPLPPPPSVESKFLINNSVESKFAAQLHVTLQSLVIQYCSIIKDVVATVSRSL